VALRPYVNANELDPPPRFHFGFGGDFDFVSALMATWFSEDEIAHFEPVERYITGEALIQRWKDKPGLQAEAFILAKIRESRLQDIHPMFGGTRGTFQEHDDFPPLTSGLFMVSQVEQVEAEDFAKPVDRGRHRSPSNSPSTTLRKILSATVVPAPPRSPTQYSLPWRTFRRAS
jgi:hypothetical protein